ncbi:hypothetical protein P7K49_018256 [Saguinus oedipus]|uniref:Uncharacterized protein n=1 Tax=Saguinus oedipus TaxID=9490 RepID=A0ABQ9V5V1_SAGOE|nr:hypothetical protein P7K49_018256 [Saguinus oedipus]
MAFSSYLLTQFQPEGEDAHPGPILPLTKPPGLNKVNSYTDLPIFQIWNHSCKDAGTNVWGGMIIVLLCSVAVIVLSAINVGKSILFAMTPLLVTTSSLMPFIGFLLGYVLSALFCLNGRLQSQHGHHWVTLRAEVAVNLD